MCVVAIRLSSPSHAISLTPLGVWLVASACTPAGVLQVLAFPGMRQVDSTDRDLQRQSELGNSFTDKTQAQSLTPSYHNHSPSVLQFLWQHQGPFCLAPLAKASKSSTKLYTNISSYIRVSTSDRSSAERSPWKGSMQPYHKISFTDCSNIFIHTFG